jgi:hypothetical protein
VVDASKSPTRRDVVSLATLEKRRERLQSLFDVDHLIRLTVFAPANAKFKGSEVSSSSLVSFDQVNSTFL